MPVRKTSLRRRVPTADIIPEQIEVLLTGDWQHGALIPRSPEFGGCKFRGIDHVREVYLTHRELVLDVFHHGWRPELGKPTMYLRDFRRPSDGSACWAEETFGPK